MKRQRKKYRAEEKVAQDLVGSSASVAPLAAGANDGNKLHEVEHTNSGADRRDEKHRFPGVEEFEERRNAEADKIRLALEASDHDDTGKPAFETSDFWERRQKEFESQAVIYGDLSAHWNGSQSWVLWWGKTQQGIEVPRVCQRVFNALAGKALKGVPGLAVLDLEPWQVWLEFMHHRRWPFEVTNIIPGNVQRVWNSAIEDGRTVYSYRDEVKYATEEPHKWRYGLLLERIFHSSALFCLELSAGSKDSETVIARRTANSEESNLGALIGHKKSGQVKRSTGEAIEAKHSRALTVAKLIKELNNIKPQMFEDETEYQKLRSRHPDFLTFKIAEDRPDLKVKVLAIRGSARHIRLAQELAAAHHGLSLSTIQDDWKDHKPPEFGRLR